MAEQKIIERHGTETLERGARGGNPVEEMGTLLERAPVGHGARGLQRKWRRLELLQP